MTTETYRNAYVYVSNRFAGILKEIDDGYTFSYDPAYLADDKPTAVSLTLPIQSEPYVSKTMFPFFDGLIPEGWLLNVVAHNWKIDLSDRFALLLVACYDCIGNVSIRSVRV